jgi:RHS repeat-associated protein
MMVAMVSSAAQCDIKRNTTGAILWGLVDNQGTIRDVVNTSGSVVEHRAFDSFGKRTTSWTGAADFLFGLNGMPYDPLAKAYVTDNSHLYEPTTGRWLSEDKGGLAVDPNLYRWCRNNPINNIDPTGLETCYGGAFGMSYDTWTGFDPTGLNGYRGEFASTTSYASSFSDFSGYEASSGTPAIRDLIVGGSSYPTQSLLLSNAFTSGSVSSSSVSQSDVFDKYGLLSAQDTRPTGLPISGASNAGAGSISWQELVYAASRPNSLVAFAFDNPWKATKMLVDIRSGCVTGGLWTSGTTTDLLTQMNVIYQKGNEFASATIGELDVENTERNHSALRHAYSSALFSKLLGPATAAALGHYREEYQLLYKEPRQTRQTLEITQRTDWNNSIGRSAAGATGEGNAFGFDFLGPRSDDSIQATIKQMFRDGYLDVGGQTGPNRPGEPLTPSPVYPHPFPQVP